MALALESRAYSNFSHKRLRPFKRLRRWRESSRQRSSAPSLFNACFVLHPQSPSKLDCVVCLSSYFGDSYVPLTRGFESKRELHLVGSLGQAARCAEEDFSVVPEDLIYGLLKGDLDGTDSVSYLVIGTSFHDSLFERYFLCIHFYQDGSTITRGDRDVARHRFPSRASNDVDYS